MSQILPIGEFTWVSPDIDIDWSQYEDDLRYGFIVECDLDYPPELHDTHNDYPLAAERVNIQIEMMSDKQEEISRHYNHSCTRRNYKLVPNLTNKLRSVCHKRLLKFYLQHGSG